MTAIFGDFDFDKLSLGSVFGIKYEVFNSKSPIISPT
jgi:hypothetical protein